MRPVRHDIALQFPTTVVSSCYLASTLDMLCISYTQFWFLHARLNPFEMRFSKKSFT